MINDLKVQDYTDKDISSLPDNPSEAGISAAMLKERFDAISKMMLAPNFNELIDRLSDALKSDDSGAHQIGFRAADARMDGMLTVAAAIIGAYNYADNKVIESGAGDMARAVYDRNGNNAVDLGEETIATRIHNAVYDAGIYAINTLGVNNIGKKFCIQFDDATGASAVLMSINNETPKPIWKGGVLLTLPMMSGQYFELRYDGTRYVVFSTGVTKLSKILTVAEWSTEAPYTQTIEASGYHPQATLASWGFPATTSKPIYDMVSQCLLGISADSTQHQLTFTAYIEKPTIDIPLLIEMRDVYERN